jgi:membrane protease YdiL (CAAX protease family)
MKLKYIGLAAGLYLFEIFAIRRLASGLRTFDAELYLLGALCALFVGVFRLGWNFEPFLKKASFWKCQAFLALFGILNMFIILKLNIADPVSILMKKRAVLVGISLYIAGPVIEELFFRQTLFRILEKAKLNRKQVVIYTASLFAISHFELQAISSNFSVYYLLQIAVTFVVGVALGTLRTKTNSLPACVLAHASYNLIITSVYLF